MLASFIVFGLPILLALASATDFLEMTIPNWIPTLLIVMFFASCPFIELTLAEISWHIAAALVVFAACFALFAINVMGGGDAKLLTAVALWYGFNGSLLHFLVYTGYLGGLLTILIILLRANWDKLATVGIRLPETMMAARKIPYAIAIGAAGLLTYPNSPLVAAAIHNLP